MAWTFAGSTSIPLWLTMKPSNFPKMALKTHLLGLNLNLYLMRSLKYLSQIYQMVSRSTQLGDHIAHIDINLLMHHIMERGYHGSMVGRPRIL